MPLDNRIVAAMQELNEFLITAYTEKSKIISDIKAGRGNASDLTDYNDSFYPALYHEIEGVIGLVERDPELAKNPQVQKFVKNISKDILSEAGVANEKIDQIVDKMEFGADSSRPSPN